MKAILHADRKWGIGRDNSLMFRLPADMRFFREKTTGNVVVMGLNTLRSLPGGRPLDGRVNVVICPDGFEAEGCVCVHDLDGLFSELKKHGDRETYVIGGAQTYRTLIPYCDEVYVTKVDADGGADAFIENLDEDEAFELVYSSERVATGDYTVTFNTYRNKAVKSFR